MGTTRSAVVAPREARQTVFGVDRSVTRTATSLAEAICPPEALALLPETGHKARIRVRHRSEPTVMFTRAGKSAVKKVKKGDDGRLPGRVRSSFVRDKQP